MASHKTAFLKFDEFEGDKIKKELFRQRLRTLNLSAVGINKQAVVQTVAKEFNKSEKAIYLDWERMETWAPTIEQHKELAFVIHARFTFLHRKVTDLMLQIGTDNQPVSLKEKFLLLGAINSALKVTAEEIKFALDTGILERKPLEINQTLSSSGAPWEGDPQIRAGLIAEIEKQKAEYDANEKALNEAEGKKECNAAADNQTAA